MASHLETTDVPLLYSPLKYVTYESVMVALTGVAWNTLSTLVSFCFTW